ncbi:MAG: hypothetical protein U1F71_14875 [Verrucomicrobiaceae bacterium]
MKIWLPRILLIPFVAFFGGSFGLLITHFFLMPKLGVHYSKWDYYSRISFWVMAAIAVLLFVLSWKKTDSRPARPDPARRSEMSRSTGVIPMLVILTGGVFIFIMFKGSLEDGARKQQPGYAAFQAADDLLMSRSQGVAHGNTPDAQGLANEFSLRLKEARKSGIESRGSPSIGSLTGGEFLTYCLLTRNSCVFMVHVPDLRNFAPEAKTFLADAAWRTALAITEPRQLGLQSVAVGFRGALMYDRVISGRLGSPENPASLRLADINGDTECQNFLQGYFAQPPPASSTVPPAPSVQPGSK